ncbi:MAG: ribonuclease P protein component [Myxococcota bacterium]
MLAPTGRFRRSERLLDSRDYRRVSSRGRRAASRCFVVIAAPARPGVAYRGPRLGITASRKVGGAVVRNAVKRRVRAWFRVGRSALPQDTDWVVIARRSAAELDGNAVGRELDRLTGRLARTDRSGG